MIIPHDWNIFLMDVVPPVPATPQELSALSWPQEPPYASSGNHSVSLSCVSMSSCRAPSLREIGTLLVCDARTKLNRPYIQCIFSTRKPVSNVILSVFYLFCGLVHDSIVSRGKHVSAPARRFVWVADRSISSGTKWRRVYVRT